MRSFFCILTLFLLPGCKALTIRDAEEKAAPCLLTVVVDADFKMSHGWGHVFECRVKEVTSGELEDSVFSISVYGTVQLYGDLLLPFKKYENLVLGFKHDPERTSGPPPGFRDSKGNYWEMVSVMQAGDSGVNLMLNTIYEYFPELSHYEGEIGTYAYDSFPPLRYSKPDPREWSNGLKETTDEDSSKGFVKIWKKDSNIKYIWITKPYPDGGEFYSFNRDTVDALYPVNSKGFLFMTEVGITRWAYRYDGSLLKTITYWKSLVGKASLQDIWAVDRIEYWPGSRIPHLIYRYETPYMTNLDGESWDSRTIFDREGKRVCEKSRKK